MGPRKRLHSMVHDPRASLALMPLPATFSNSLSATFQVLPCALGPIRIGVRLGFDQQPSDGVGRHRVKTAPRYVTVVFRFLEWAEQERLMLATQPEADYAGYLYSESIIMHGHRKTWLLPLESALKYFDPGHGGKGN